MGRVRAWLTDPPVADCRLSQAAQNSGLYLPESAMPSLTDKFAAAMQAYVDFAVKLKKSSVHSAKFACRAGLPH